MREIQQVLEQRGYRGLASWMRVDHIDTPRTWADKGMLDGSPFSAAHLFRQTGPSAARTSCTASTMLSSPGRVPRRVSASRP